LFLFGKNGEQSGQIWINAGIAGHGSRETGEVMLAHKVEEAGTDVVWYPGMALEERWPSDPLITVQRPVQQYLAGVAYDMEAAGFYQAAVRLSTTELIHCFKVVSDNPGNPADKINEAQVKSWIAAGVPTLQRLMQQLETLAGAGPDNRVVKKAVEKYCARWRFSHYQQQQLAALLTRWNTLAPEDVAWCDSFTCLPSARAVLAEIARIVDAKPAAI
jgi:hypothetical protein